MLPSGRANHRLWGESVSPARSRWLASVPLVVALVGGALLLPRPAVPDAVPLPAVDEGAFAAIVKDDAARAARARAEGLPGDVREFGTLVREFNHREATDDDATRIASARTALDRALPALVAPGADPLKTLRAVQLEAFLNEARAFERTGQASDELVALAGPFVERMRAVGWCRGAEILLTEEERRVAYKLAWNGVAGVDRRADFALSLDEMRVLYGLYLRLPHAPEPQIRAFAAARAGAKDDAACAALTAGERLAAESWRLERIGRLAGIDPTYPVAYAKGIAQYRLGKFLAAGDAFESHLRDHPDGPYTIKARNFLRAAMIAAQGEHP